MEKKIKVLIIGYGEMGHAMEFLLRDHFHIDIWDKYSQDNTISVLSDDTLVNADIILFCIPVNPHQEIASTIMPLLKDECLCLSIAKGLDETGKTAAQIFSEVFSVHQPYGCIYGPMISEEIRAGHYAFAQVACNKTNNNSRVKKLFYGSKLLIQETSDIVGISWSVILKNVYALAFGMADELKLGDNVRGFLSVTALYELDKIVNNMGGVAGSSYHLAGLGDLITTATSESSHHHELGRRLARGETQNITGEGIHTLKMVDKYNLLNKAEYPLYNFIFNTVADPHEVRQQFDSYLHDNF